MNDTATGKTVKFSLDLKNPPPLTEEQKARFDKLSAMKDEDIDFSDIPKVDKKDWVRAQPMGTGNKAQITIKIDQEILDFFRSQGARYQTRINSVLQEYVRAHR